MNNMLDPGKIENWPNKVYALSRLNLQSVLPETTYTLPIVANFITSLIR